MTFQRRLSKFRSIQLTHRFVSPIHPSKPHEVQNNQIKLDTSLSPAVKAFNSSSVESPPTLTLKRSSPVTQIAQLTKDFRPPEEPLFIILILHNLLRTPDGSSCRIKVKHISPLLVVLHDPTFRRRPWFVSFHAKKRSDRLHPHKKGRKIP